MAKISAYAQDTAPTLDDFTVTVDNTSSATKKVTWASALALVSVTPQSVAPAQSIATGTTIVPVTTSRMYIVANLATDAGISAPTGTTPADGQGLTLRIKDNGVTRALSFNGTYRAIGVTIPTATTPNKTMYISLAYNANDNRWDVLAVARES